MNGDRAPAISIGAHLPDASKESEMEETAKSRDELEQKLHEVNKLLIEHDEFWHFGSDLGLWTLRDACFDWGEQEGYAPEAVAKAYFDVLLLEIEAEKLVREIEKS